MIRTGTLHTAKVVPVTFGGAAQSAVFTLSNYMLMSYETERSGQSLLTRELYAYRIDLQKGWLF